MSKGQRHSWSIRTRSGAVQFQMCNLDAKAGLSFAWRNTTAFTETWDFAQSLGFLSLFYLTFYIARWKNCFPQLRDSDLVFVKLLKRWHLVAKLTRWESTWKNSKLKPSWNHYVKQLETHYYILWLRLRDYLEVNICCLPALGMSWSWFTNRTICALFSTLHLALKILSLSLIL